MSANDANGSGLKTLAAPQSREMTRRSLDDDDELSIERILLQKKKIQECMKLVMQQGEHYGIVPGTSKRDRDGNETAKPSLFKAGAETLCFIFRLRPEYTIEDKVKTDKRIDYTIRCRLIHIPTERTISEGLGCCNSSEAKYRRPAPKICPSCGKDTIFKSKNPGEGYFCWAKKGGCGATYAPGDEAIDGQPSGVADPSDLDNTILKMACKRSYVGAVLAGTAASDFFSQDLEDLTDAAAGNGSPAAGDARASAADNSMVEVTDENGVVSRQPRASADQVTEIGVLAHKMRLPPEMLEADLQARYNVSSPENLGRGQAIEWIRRANQVAGPPVVKGKANLDDLAASARASREGTTTAAAATPAARVDTNKPKPAGPTVVRVPAGRGREDVTKEDLGDVPKWMTTPGGKPNDDSGIS